MSYCTPQEVREVSTGLAVGAQPIAWSDDVLRSLIERASRMFDLECGVDPEWFESVYQSVQQSYPIWQATHAYVVGDVVTPTIRNAHTYRVTVAGTTGSAEPVFPTSSGATVVSGSVTFTENGADIVPTARVFYGDGTNFLRLDPYVPGTLSGTIVMPDGYTAPEFTVMGQYLALSADGLLVSERPWLSLGGWLRGVPVTATAIWGYESTPADVKQAVIELVIELARSSDPAFLKITDVSKSAFAERWKWTARRYQMKGVAFV